MTTDRIGKLAWNKMDGLLPAIVQDADTLQVLMVAYMSREALEKTLASRQVTFFSRSREALWTKGETSGNFLALVDVEEDCDGDALLVRARPTGPTCHRGTTACFGEASAPGMGFLGKLSSVIAKRFEEKPEGSYTTKLIERGIDRMAQKVGEEGVETVIAAKNPDTEAFLGEASDLVFHLMVLLRARGLSLEDVARVLAGRHKG